MSAMPDIEMPESGPAEIEVVVDDARWAKRLEAPEAVCARAAAAALAAAAAPSGALCVLLADDSRLRALNLEFRAKDAPTNVLSFPMGPLLGSDKAPMGETEGSWLGDVALAFETVEREARAQGKPLADHLTHLVVHGTLHLLGHDHLDDEEAERMEALERRILAGLNISDPYREHDAAQR